MVDEAARSAATETLIVALERSPGSGVFVVDERLRAEEVLLAGDETISTARIAVRLDETFDTAAARARYHADLRVVVRTEAADLADQVVLFEGYPPIQNAKWHGGPGRGEESFSFDAEHVFARLSRDRESWIYGRQMRNGEIADGLSADPSAWAHRSVLIEALRRSTEEG